LGKVSRKQLGDAVRPAFEEGPASRADLIRVAGERGAGSALTGTLARLPEGKRFAALRDLWEYLPDLPVESPPGVRADQG
jgi:hypothetical protein